MDAITQQMVLDVRALALELVARGDMLGGIAAMSIVDRAEQALLADLDGHQALTLAEWQAIPHHMIGGFDGVVFIARDELAGVGEIPYPIDATDLERATLDRFAAGDTRDQYVPTGDAGWSFSLRAVPTLAGPDCDKCACPAAQHDPESGDCDSYRSEDDGGTEANGYTCPCPGYTPRGSLSIPFGGNLG